MEQLERLEHLDLMELMVHRESLEYPVLREIGRASCRERV